MLFFAVTILKECVCDAQSQAFTFNGRTVTVIMLDKIALFILLVGGLNWGLVGLFQFDVIAWAFGGSAGIISRILYIVVALAAVWCISLFFRQNEVIDTGRDTNEMHN